MSITYIIAHIAIFCNICNTVSMDISTWLKDATKQFKDIGIDSNRLDAELILSHTLRKPRTYLHAHLEEELEPRRKDVANARLELRKERVPLAYIIGHKEFYGRRFKVTPATLIPRPESEDMISLFLELTAEEITTKRLVDVGTGSGCLGITAKLERPNLNVTLLDVDSKALAVAQKNSLQLNADVLTQRSDLLTKYHLPVDYIFANLPYVDRSWNGLSPELKSEPEQALFADEGGLKLIKKLLPQATKRIIAGGKLFIEADPAQHNEIITTAAKLGLQHQATRGYILLFSA